MDEVVIIGYGEYNGSVVALRSGQDLQIILESNPTTLFLTVDIDRADL